MKANADTTISTSGPRMGGIRHFAAFATIAATLCAASLTFGYTPLHTAFPGATLPTELRHTGASGGNSSYAVNNGLTLTTADGAAWYRSAAFTYASDYLWAGAQAPIYFSFTLSSPLSAGLDANVYFYLLGDDGARAVTDPDQTKAAAIGLVLGKDGSLKLSVKEPTGSVQGFSAYTKYTLPTAQLDPTATSFGFVIENNTMTLLVDGQKVGDAVSLASVAGSFTTSSSLFLSTINDKNNPSTRSVSFSALYAGATATPVPEPATVTMLAGLAAIALAAVRLHKHR
ncbi:PEP-CTERM motif protein [Opitutaceae bacterium TAV1]|nr:PEP-CTERM motif protein [Opitutaceae bacterium TAV1]